MDGTLQPTERDPECRNWIRAALGSDVEADAGTLIPRLCRVLCDDEAALSPRSNDTMPASGVREPAIHSRRDAAAAVLQQFPVGVIRAQMEREIDPDLCHRLIPTMGCEPSTVADAAFRVLWALEDLAADPLLQALRNASAPKPGGSYLSDSQATALVLLVARCGDRRATEALCEALCACNESFSRWKFISAAIKALGDMRDARAVPVIAEYLKSYTQSFRLLAAVALGKIGHRSALPDLHRLLSLGLTWGDPVVTDNWVDRLLTTRVFTYETDPEVRAAVKQAISLIEQTSPEIADLPFPAAPPSDPEPDIANLPFPAMPRNDPETADLPRPVE